MQKRLRIGGRPEAHAGRFELGAQLLVVVDLAVEGDDDVAVRTRQNGSRLGASSSAHHWLAMSPVTALFPISRELAALDLGVCHSSSNATASRVNGPSPSEIN